MTIGALKQKLLFYTQKASDDTYFDFGSSPTDMLLDALNEARKQAELSYAFEMNKRVVTYSSVVGSVDWQTEAAIGEDAPEMRSLKKVWTVASDSTLRELRQVYRENSKLATQIWPETLVTGCTHRQYSLVGPILYITPANTEAIDLLADGYIWMDEYTSDEDEDWMCKHGHNYLFWAALYYLNHKVKEFVQRQEGNLALSNGFVQEQLAKLISWDSAMKHGGSDLSID